MSPEELVPKGFVQQLTEFQPRLYAYILTLLQDREMAHDVLQETNVVLLGKVEEFGDGVNFEAKACRFAYFQVLARRRDLARDRLLFDDTVLEQVADTAANHVPELDQRHRALRACMEKLSGHQRKLLTRRYETGSSVERMAEQSGGTPNSVAAALYRVRQTLQECIQGRLKKDP